MNHSLVASICFAKSLSKLDGLRVKPEDFFSKQDIENARSRMLGWVHSLARSGR